MTSDIEDGGPAFPTVKSSLMRDHVREAGRFTHDYETVGGMSLRDWFAGLSVQASPELMSVVTSGSILDGTAIERMARRAYQVADAMLAARATKRP